MTEAQQQAVRARGNVIVVAGAGTGKTSTLVERCIALLAGGTSIESILMVTFTEAAAAEMRHRLRGKLAEVAAQALRERADEWQEQLALLDTAHICTLHSFCLQLVRENFHLLGIDPGVKILDDQQTRPLIESALDATVEPHFSGADEPSQQVRELIQRYGQGDVEQIRSLVLKLHRYAQSLDAPARWFEDQITALASTDPAMWLQWRAAGVKSWAESWRSELDRVAATAGNLARCAAAVRALAEAPEDLSAGQRFAEIAAADGDDWPKGLKTKLRKPFEKFFEEAEFLSSQFDEAGLKADWENVRGPLRALLLLAREFGDRFATAKRELGGIDFADLEQFALRLLWENEGQLSAVAREWRGRFKHVFVDECQDINAAQDAILRAVSRSEAGAANRFLVGDVKQSIYQFRLARPALFRGYERAWAEGAGTRISLAENFRSDPEIIRFVNALFTPLMRDEVGGVAYEPLASGRKDGNGEQNPEPQRRVEFCLLGEPEANEAAAGETGEEAALEDLRAVEREARAVAMRLRELHESGAMIWDKDAKVRRRVEWRDMAVLLRSPRSRVEAFAMEFHKCGVPLQAARSGFLASTEVSDLLSLLRLLDNPLQDIPLLAVLRSPLVALSLDELAEVRAISSAKRFWVALREFHRAGAAMDARENLPASARTAWEKVDWLLQRFAVWRDLARQASLSHCLEVALRDSHYEAVLAAGERGAARVANIRKLIATVRQYDPYQRQGLFRFLKFVDSLTAAELDIEPAPAPSQNAVRLMSIHQSKGLEFPVTVVACLGGMFNAQDLSRDVLLDEGYGLCAKAAHPESGARYPTLAHWLAARRQRRQMLGEELRLLYVAFTRARDFLLLVATATKKDYEAWEPQEMRSLTNQEILKARSPLDWLMLWLPMVTRRDDWNDGGGLGELLAWRIVRERLDLQPTQVDAQLTGEQTPVDAAVVAAVKRRIGFVYPQVAAPTETAKTTVTALRRKAEELTDEDAKPWVFGGAGLRRDRRSEREFDAAEIGTLHHRFLQRMSLAGACDEADLKRQAEEMSRQGVLTASEAAVLDLAALAKFWGGAVGAEIRAQNRFVRRELPFTARFTPKELERLAGRKMAPGLENEFVVVQGVADLVVSLPREIWLLDFKTDRMNASQRDEKVAAYRPQLEIYAAALAAIYRVPVTRRWLHFLSLRETVTV